MDVETATGTPRSAVSLELRIRGHTLVQDKPATLGGQDKGPMASELLLAALLACQHSTFVKVAAKRRTDAHMTALSGACHFDAAGDISKLTVEATVQGAAADKDVDTALRLTEKTCTISRVVKCPVEVTWRRT